MEIVDLEGQQVADYIAFAERNRTEWLNRQFHFRLYECARSPMLLLLMRLLWRSFPEGPQAGRPHRKSVRQHADLVKALKRRDEDRVAAIIRDHVLGNIGYLR